MVWKEKVAEQKQRTVPDFSELKVGVGLGEAGGGATEVVVIDGAENGIGGALVRSPKKLGEEAAQHCEITVHSLCGASNKKGDESCKHEPQWTRLPCRLPCWCIVAAQTLPAQHLAPWERRLAQQAARWGSAA